MAQGNMAEMLGSLLSALNSEGSEENAENTENTAEGFDFGSFFENIDMDMIFKVGEIFSRMNNNDHNTELLRALKPHMRDVNKDKIDTAIKLLKIASLLPFLRESGLFDKML